MTIPDFIHENNLDGSMLLGYYGGGNYGDELLLEILQNMLSIQGVKRVSIAYQHPENFSKLHHDFGYQPFSIKSRTALVKATLSNRYIVVGGGGLWGVDMNQNTFQMSAYLWVCRWLLRRKVYLFGVGYYRSTSLLGHIGAWFAAKAANRIFARDKESYDNFRKFARRKTELDKDMAWYIADLPLDRYHKAARQLARNLGLRAHALILTTRRPQAEKQRNKFVHYNQIVEHYISENPDKQIVLAPLEFSRTVPNASKPPHSSKAKARVTVLDPAINPLTIYSLFKLYHDKLLLIGPQFHIMLTAHLTQVPFLPICYDNKVRELFDRINIARSGQLAVEAVTVESLRHFIDHYTLN